LNNKQVNSSTRPQVALPTVSTAVSAARTEGVQPEQSNLQSVQQSAFNSKARVSLVDESEEIQSVNIDLLKYIKVFTGSPDYPWEEFLPAFENAAEFGRWNDKTKCHLVKSKFGGNALKLMTSIKERGLPYTFQTIKDEFEQHFGDPVNEDTYFNRFCNLKCKDGESVQSFSQRTEEIFRKAFPTEKIDAPRLKSGFIRGLPSSIREKVENRNPKNFKEAKTAAIEIQQRLLEERKLYRPEYELAAVKAVQNPSVSLSPENLNLLLNLSEWAKRLSPSLSLPVVDSSPSTTESDEKTSPSSVAGTRPRLCDFCRKPGHHIRYCQQHKQYLESLENKTQLNPEYKPFVPIENRECYNCKGVGHLAKDCTSKQSVNTNDHTE
jgi:Ty3 transposon capsid-like protein/Zinc knuckle